MNYSVTEIRAKSILQKSGLPGTNWVINPYRGCAFGCKYCYATFVGRFWHPDQVWGMYVDVKIDAPELLKKELLTKMKGKKKKDIGSIFISSVTDPYQGLEIKYQLTKDCLKVLLDVGYEGNVSILTKSHLVLRDVDILRKFPDIEVGLTVTSTDDPLTRYLETYAPPNHVRLETLRQLHKAGITTYAHVGPLLPHVVQQEKELGKLLTQLKKAGVGFIYLEHINMSPYIRDRLFAELSKDHSEEIAQFRKAQSPQYRKDLDRILMRLVRKVGLPVVHQQAIYHKEKASWKSLSS